MCGKPPTLSSQTNISPNILDLYLSLPATNNTRFSSRPPKLDTSTMTTLCRVPPPISKPQRPPPDLTDFMNDMFFGTIQTDPKSYDFSGATEKNKNSNSLNEDDQYDKSFDSPRSKSGGSNTSKLTQEWLNEARRIVASSPGRHGVCESPTSRLSGSPRFATQGRAAQAGASLINEKRDPLSRSARMHKAVEGFSGEILIKSAKHHRNKSKSGTPEPPSIGGADSADLSPTSTSAAHKWFSTILNPSAVPSLDSISVSSPLSTSPDPIGSNLPPRLSVHRKSRFQTNASGTQPFGIRRTLSGLSSPAGKVVESAPRRSVSLRDDKVLSPPRNLVESAHRKSISSTTCSVERFSVKVEEKQMSGNDEGVKNLSQNLNEFLKQQKKKMKEVQDGEGQGKAKIVLSGTSNSTSSMLAAICYAWLLENKARNEKESDANEVVVPVINVRRSRMWKLRQATWLFHHVGIDAGALLFADEVDFEILMMSRKLSILVVGQDVLRSSGEVGSQCTILTDNYCEDAYDLLQTSELKNLLLAGILLDTQNLNASAKSSMTRDAEAVQLLLVGLSPSYRNTLYDQLVQDQREGSFLEILRENYGKHPSEKTDSCETGATVEPKVWGRRSTSSPFNGDIVQYEAKNTNDARSDKPYTVSPKYAKTKPSAQMPTAAPVQDSGGQNKFSLAKWFGFGGK